MDARESLDHRAYTYYAFIGSGNRVGAAMDVKEAGRTSKEAKEASPGVSRRLQRPLGYPKPFSMGVM